MAIKHHPAKKPTTQKVPAAPKPQKYPSVVTPPLGKVRFAPFDGTSSVECWLNGEAIPSPRTGWQVASRDGRKGVLEWNGTDPDRITVPILLDGWQGDDSVQASWDALVRMASQPNDETPPTKILVTGGLPTPRGEWVIETLTPEAGALMPDGLTLYRQAATIVLLEATFGSVIRKPIAKGKAAAKKNSGSKSGAKKRVVTVAAHDTLQTIAHRYLGDAGRAHEIAKLNGIRDGEHLKAGSHLKLP